MNQEMKNYEVQLVEVNLLEVTGKGDNPLWQNAVILTDFTSPWDAEKPKKIEFKAVWDGINLFFCFTVFDT